MKIFLLYSSSAFPWSALGAAVLAGKLPESPGPQEIWGLDFMPNFHDFSDGMAVTFSLPGGDSGVIAFSSAVRPPFLERIINSVLYLANSGGAKVIIRKIDIRSCILLGSACHLYKLKWLRGAAKKIITKNIIKALQNRNLTRQLD